MTLNLKFQPHESADYKDVEATVIKRFEPVTSAIVLLVQRHSDNEHSILKLGYRRLGNRANNDTVEVPWSSSIEDHLRRAIRDIRGSRIPNWFELINDRENRLDPELWEDWMWEVLLGSQSVVRLYITSESTPLHPITDTVEGLVLEYIPGVCMDKLRPDIDVSEQEAERISSEVMEGLRAIEAENRECRLREGSLSAVIIDFGISHIRQPGISDERWSGVVHGGPDTRYMRRLLVDPEGGRWKRTVTPREMSEYRNPLAFNKYVENMPEDFRRATFDRMLDTDWEGAREKVYQWCIKPGAFTEVNNYVPSQAHSQTTVSKFLTTIPGIKIDV
ncbi:hypothetical protein ARMSODRAFT_973600 [Armillaria solidipes]|uniref:Protein kinase domain-containing protein n=1 Tax=Armillaria solidipes TaxID=1076256 RepID=A0A2H3BJU1_9AGAR|nr:hypothetical protein ARMSODRAFT_973600 [Armillaria solidipes]